MNEGCVGLPGAEWCVGQGLGSWQLCAGAEDGFPGAALPSRAGHV